MTKKITQSAGRAQLGEFALVLRFVRIDVAKMRIGYMKDRKRLFKPDLHVPVRERKPFMGIATLEEIVRLGRCTVFGYAGGKARRREKPSRGSYGADEISPVHGCFLA